MSIRRLLTLVLSLTVLATAGGGAAAAAPRGQRPQAFGPTPPRQVVPNTSPRLTNEIELTVAPGRSMIAALPISDPEGDDVRVVATGPSGLTAVRGERGTWLLRWEPETTGSFVAGLRLTDEHGAARDVPITLRSTNPRSADSLLGLGDSVASGHGLQKRDYLRRDDCWRSEKEAYPWHVYEGLVEQGVFSAGGDYNLVACSGATLGDLLDEPVGGGPADARPAGSSRMSQVDWAIASNPEIVTLTAGANTLGFSDPWRLLHADGTLDTGEVERRLGRVEDDLDAVLDRLVDHTDSWILVTNYYNPASSEPHGIEGCRTECFRQRSEEVVAALDESISAVVARFPEDRVVQVDLVEAFEGHGAPNGLGPDGLRAGATGWIRRVIGAPVEGVHPYCTRGHDDAGSWINYVDCVHPDGRGHREIARVILEAVAAA